MIHAHAGRTDLWLKETRRFADLCLGYHGEAPCRWLERRRHGRVHSISSPFSFPTAAPPAVAGERVRENHTFIRQQFVKHHHSLLLLRFCVSRVRLSTCRLLFRCSEISLVISPRLCVPQFYCGTCPAETFLESIQVAPLVIHLSQ